MTGKDCHNEYDKVIKEPLEEAVYCNESEYDFLHPRNLLFGTPKYATEKFQDLQDELNLQHLLLWVDHNGLSHEKKMRSLKLFTEKVMPNFK